MSSVPSPAVMADDNREGAGEAGPPQRPGRRVVIAGGAVAVLAVIGVVAADGAGAFGNTGHPGSGATGNGGPTSLATVTQGTLSSQTEANATLGYAGSYTVINRATGTFTSLPAAGQVFSRGQVIYRVSGSPVILLYGSVPAYRTLSEGMSGADVRQLNANLVALGYATRSELSPSSTQFSGQTTTALEKLQKHLGVDQTGTLTPGQAVFLPSAIRITTVNATVGASAGPGLPVVKATSAVRQVQVSLDAALQSDVKVGDRVTISLPNNLTTPGVVSSVGTVATSGGSQSSPTVTVYVTPTHPAATGSLDQAPVQVSITTGTVSGALIVPVNALLATASGGYSVEVAERGGTHRLVPVALGLFDDAAGTVQVISSGLKPGQRVVVPTP